MKSYIFTEAWKLVRSKGITISEALKTVWAFVKGQSKLIEKIAEIVSNDERYTLKSLAPEVFATFDFKTFHNGLSTRKFFVSQFKKSLSDLPTLHKVAKIVKANKTAKQFISLQY